MNSTNSTTEPPNNDALKLGAQMQLFTWSAGIFWLICAFALYNQQLKFKKRRRNDDIFLELETATEEGEVQYLVSFFTGRGYRYPPSGNVRLHLIGSLYPGKFHTLRKENVTAPDDRDEYDEEEDEEDGNGSGHDLLRSRSRKTIKSDPSEEPTRAKRKAKKKKRTGNQLEKNRLKKSSSWTRRHPKHLFPPNCHEKFLITEDVCLGRITMIVLQTEVEGRHPYWDCESVIVRDVSTNEAWYFRARSRIGFPPVILDPATVQELTTFCTSWHRRVRREVRHGQYVFFGFWFRLKNSVYTFGQRVLVAIVCYFNLFCNSLLYLGLAFPPHNELKTTTLTAASSQPQHHHSHFIRSKHLNYWVSHVIVVGVCAALTTTAVGYLIVTLFREKSKYEWRVHEMDYVIGTALQEYNEMKKEISKIRERTGKESKKKKRKQGEKENNNKEAVVNGSPDPDAGHCQGRKDNASLAKVFSATGVSKASVEDVEKASDSTTAEPEPSPSKPSIFRRITTILTNGPIQNIQKMLAKTPSPPSPTVSYNAVSPESPTEAALPTTKSKGMLIVTNENEKTPLLKNMEQHQSEFDRSLQPQASKMGFPKQSRSELLAAARYPVSVNQDSEPTPQEQRELMRSLFDQDEVLVGDSEFKSGSSIEMSQSSNLSANSGYHMELALAKAQERGKVVLPRRASAATLLEDPVKDPERRFPQPILGWLALLIVIIIPIIAIFFWLGPILTNLSQDGLFRSLNMILSAYMAAVIIEVIGIETLKMGLLGAYYAFTDKYMYKKIIRAAPKRKRKPKGRQSVLQYTKKVE